MLGLGLGIGGARRTINPPGPPPTYEALLSFPGAEGPGRFARGGFGAGSYTAYTVTNRNASGAGSLAAALLATGPRVILFDVGGTINTGQIGYIEVGNGDVVIAGQTAPGEGIQITGSGIRFTNAQNVQLRYIRSRPGRFGPSSGAGEYDAITFKGASPDYNSDKVMVDHCSVSLSTDENMSLDLTTNATFQYCIFSYPIKNDVEPGSGYNSLTINNNTNVLFFRNLYTQAKGRNPYFTGGTIQHVNNVGFNAEIPNDFLPADYSTSDFVRVDYVSNYTIRGATGSIAYGSNINTWGPSNPYVSQATYDASGLYLKSNVFDRGGSNDRPDWTTQPESAGMITYNQGAGADILKSTPYFPGLPGAYIENPNEAYTAVMADVGCNLPAQDSLDILAIQDVTTRNSRWIAEESEVGGIPVLPTVARAAGWDTDGDGCPNQWCIDNGLATDSDIGPDYPAFDGGTSQWRYLEHYLNHMAGTDTLGLA